MKISAGSWQNQSYGRTAAEMDAAAAESRPKEEKKAPVADETRSEPFNSSSRQSSHGGAVSGKIKSSVPDDQVGTLAIQLANSQTKMDVQQVSGKAMRSLVNLKMCCISCDEKDKKKVLQMIRRTEKLIKRIRTKIRCLTKEEDLEKRRKKAEEKERQQEAKDLQDELRSRQRKRRREEWDYALKESTQHGDSSGSLPLPLSGAGAASSLPSGISAAAGAASAPASADAAAAVAAESAALDVTV